MIFLRFWIASACEAVLRFVYTFVALEFVSRHIPVVVRRHLFCFWTSAKLNLIREEVKLKISILIFVMVSILWFAGDKC